MSLAVLSTKLGSKLQKSISVHGARAMTVLSKDSGEEYKKMNYTKRMKETGRPVSPHVTIYAFPMAAISSITCRVTGCALSVGCAGLGAVELVAGSGSALHLMQFIGSQGFLIAAGAKFCVAFPTIYHFGGAVRHLYWDSKPEALTNEEVEKLSFALFGGSTVLSLGAMLM